ncbi:MAG TPA: DNA polymerase I [Acidimicrobiales bacterium]|nr:DNA polymerase I [Acidimicrobiales bacterium]
MAPYLLLDGHSLAFRAWFALQDANLVTSSGQETQAVYGFAGMLGRLLDDHSPAGIAVAFDRGEPTFRDELEADYKAGRAPTPDSLHEQVNLIRRMVELMGIPVVELPGYEADDVLATLATRLEAAGEDVIVVTGDRDTYQLVSDPHVKVLYNRRGVTDYVLYDEAGIEERTGVRPEKYPVLAALRGDPSDNLPGVPGVGEKTAAKLVNTYGDLDTLFSHLDELSPKLRQSLSDNEERVRRNFALTPLVRDAPVTCELEDLHFGRSDRDELVNLFNLLEIRAPRDKILSALDRLEGRTQVAPPETAPAPRPLRTVSVEEPLEGSRLLEELNDTDGGIALEPEWSGTPGRSELVGLALVRVEPPEAGGERRAVFVPAGLFEPLRPGLEALLGRRRGLERLVCFRAKELMRRLIPDGFDLSGLDLDLAVVSYLVDPSGPPARVEALGAAQQPSEPPATQLGFALGPDSAGPSPAEAAAGRAALLADMAPSVRRRLAETGAEELYSAVERPLIGVLARMEVAGIAVDRRRLEEINDELTTESERLEAEVQRLAGEPFKVNSTPQLRHVLFEVLGLTPQKKTKTGYSTDAQSLERLRDAHPIIEALLAYREVEKLRSTYGTGLLSEVAGDGRIHASFNQTVARTGRLSSDQPNLHNIPVRSELGRQFREAFVPAAGFELLVADYDQIELRVIAHLAEDPGLIEAFTTGVDIHSATAQRVFGVDAAGVTPAMRARAKMVSYGLAYGMEAYGLSQRLAIPVEEAAAILNQYFTAFPNVKAYMNRAVADARARGYTETLFGRRRYLPDLASSNFQVRQAAERQAMNAGIQGLAADIFKVALVRLDAALAERGLSSRIVLQVHDEIIVESALSEAAEVATLTEEVMRSAADLSVPLAVHVASGPSWAAAKEGGAAVEADEDVELALLADDVGGG